MTKKNIRPSPKKGSAKTNVITKPAIIREESPQKKIFLIAGILIITFLVYFPSLHNELLKTWDDQAYVTHNDLIKSLSFDNIKRIFREDRGLYANYHPLTTLSLAVNFQFSKLDSPGYHVTNLLFHLLNTLLVFIFIYKLCGRRLEIAAVVSLLFGLNPMHVESVSWISERKDVLYTFFFLLSVIAYQYYLKRNDFKFYFLSILLFLCSLLSKAMAASLPLVLLLIDYFLKRKWNARIILEKLPYFALAVILGIFAIHIQAEGHATSSQMFPIYYRFMHACYSFMLYILKTFIPSGLSAFYPYPYPLVNGGWIISGTPLIFYVTVILIIALLILLIFNIIRPRKYSDIIVFGILFYAFTIALVLQFLPVGRAIMADRYSYIPSIGLFFIAGAFFSHLYRNKKFKIPAIVAIMVYSGILCYLTFERNKVWKNDETLWNDVIRQYPEDSRVTLAIYNRANYFDEKENFSKALKDYQTVAEYNPGDDGVLEKIGKIYGQKLNDLDNALLFLQKAYKLNPVNIEVIQDLSTVYGMKGDPRRSLQYSLKGLELKADDALLLLNAGISYKNTGESEKGDTYIAKAHKIDPALKP